MIIELSLIVFIVIVYVNADVSPITDDVKTSNVCSGSGIWGTYRPGHYIGIKSLNTSSPLIGAMYTDLDLGDSWNHIRHDCDDRDRTSFGYDYHDGKCSSRQSLSDAGLGIDLTSEFVHTTHNEESGFLLRLSGASRKQASAAQRIALLWYISLQNKTHSMSLSSVSSKFGVVGEVNLRVNLSDIGQYRVITSQSKSNRFAKVSDGGRDRVMRNVFVGSAKLLVDDGWKVKDIVRQQMQESSSQQIQRLMAKKHKNNEETEQSHNEMLREILNSKSIVAHLNNVVVEDATVLVFQHMLELPFAMDIAFIPENALKSATAGASNSPDSLEDVLEDEDDEDEDNEEMHLKHDLLDTQWVTNTLTASEKNFVSHFNNVFDLSRKGYDEAHVVFAQRALSDMSGSIGSFFGSSLHRSRTSNNVLVKAAQKLLAVVPARAMFPRGFLWDEGFHQLLLSKFNEQQSQIIIEHWCNLIESDGWLPREQILGAEARARVPQEFQVQDPSMANPPTLFLAILQIAKSCGAFDDDVSVELDASSQQRFNKHGDQQRRANTLAWIRRIYPSLRRHADWLLRTQAAQRQHSFRWNSRSSHCLASGLDDFPRVPISSLASPNTEGHVDLHCWMIFVCQSMQALSQSIGDDTSSYGKKALVLQSKLIEYHWDNNNQMFFDYYQHINETSTKYDFMHARGYVNLFPLALGVLDADSLHLKALLDLLADEDHVWTKFGIRSLSAQDKNFGTNENYWRGPIWYNVNYLIVSQLHRYGYDVVGPYQSLARNLYNNLRTNLIENAFNVFTDTGYLWEQYDAIDGTGRRSHPFTGWTALVVLMMAEMF